MDCQYCGQQNIPEAPLTATGGSREVFYCDICDAHTYDHELIRKRSIHSMQEEFDEWAQGLESE